MTTSKEEEWYQRPLQVGIISGITTGVVVGIFLIIISSWMQENVEPSIILLNHTTKNSQTDFNKSEISPTIGVNLLITNPSSKSIILEDIILDVQVNGSSFDDGWDGWLPRLEDSWFDEEIIRGGEQLISSSRPNNFSKVPFGEHIVRVTVLYYNGKSNKNLYGYFNITVYNDGTVNEFYKEHMKLRNEPQHLDIAEYNGGFSTPSIFRRSGSGGFGRRSKW